MRQFAIQFMSCFRNKYNRLIHCAQRPKRKQKKFKWTYIKKSTHWRRIKKRDKFHQMNKTKQAKVKKLPYMRPEFIISLRFCTKKSTQRTEKYKTFLTFVSVYSLNSVECLPVPNVIFVLFILKYRVRNAPDFQMNQSLFSLNILLFSL